MIKSIPFRTQARTVDHLGREQIADCPTAISELWKNAYDAYAREVSLHIFDGDVPVAAIFDDGHGMNYDEFVNRWLVVGTESKYDASEVTEGDQNGLETRTKQGQKGIGRLSSANLGPLLLVVSKRKNQDFVAALIDWRIFENPFLVLSDVEIPVTSFKNPSDLFDLLPLLFENLTENVWGSDSDPERKTRLEQAWKAFDALITSEDNKAQSPSEKIAETIINARFEPRHLEKWSVWSGKVDHGTGLLVSDINYDLSAQLPNILEDGTIADIRKRFFETLSAFTDPLVDPEANEINAFDPNFDYDVKVWTGDRPKSIVQDNVAYDRSVANEMEHIIEGTIDNQGVFKGQIKAFGEWRELGQDYVLLPPKDFEMPEGPTTFVGPVSLYLATYERERVSSTHSDDQHARFNELAEKYGAFLIFRNGLRVLPYGRIDNDFFEIEQRRSVSAGREFWNARRMFGRLAISREENPNLRDKAGREGFIDNRAAKALKTIVVNVLRQSAKDYFGQASDIRKPTLADIQEKNREAKAEQERKDLARRNRKLFRSRLKRNLPLLQQLEKRFSDLSDGVELDDQGGVIAFQERLDNLRSELDELKIIGAPRPLGTAEEDFRIFKSMYDHCQGLVQDYLKEISAAIEKIQPAKPEEILEQQLQRQAGQIHARIRTWRKKIDDLQKFESNRLATLLSERNKIFHEHTLPILERVKQKRMKLPVALEKLEQWRIEIDSENEEIFDSYINVLELLKENIDVDLIASQGSIDNSDLRDQLNRLNQLAQLGVTVEILGHELNTHDQMISSGLNMLGASENSVAIEKIRMGYEGLSHQLEFLSPLKLSGHRTSRLIDGKEITSYIEEFFETALDNRDIDFDPTEAFKEFSINEQPARLFPVFINLINNSIYWLVMSKTEKPKIKLSVVNNIVIISDNGPGVDSIDIPQLFKMYFSRKVSGGRGIGLYLCRVNLLAGGHSITYATSEEYRVLSGANFAIDFKGASFD